MQTADFIGRPRVGQRASVATFLGATGYFPVTPEAPYDGKLSIRRPDMAAPCQGGNRLARIGSGKDQLAFVAINLADMADYQAGLASPYLKVERS